MNVERTTLKELCLKNCLNNYAGKTSSGELCPKNYVEEAMSEGQWLSLKLGYKEYQGSGCNGEHEGGVPLSCSRNERTAAF